MFLYMTTGLWHHGISITTFFALEYHMMGQLATIITYSVTQTGSSIALHVHTFQQNQHQGNYQFLSISQKVS